MSGCVCILFRHFQFRKKRKREEEERMNSETQQSTLSSHAQFIVNMHQHKQMTVHKMRVYLSVTVVFHSYFISLSFSLVFLSLFSKSKSGEKKCTVCMETKFSYCTQPHRNCKRNQCDNSRYVDIVS